MQACFLPVLHEHERSPPLLDMHARTHSLRPTTRLRAYEWYNEKVDPAACKVTKSSTCMAIGNMKDDIEYRECEEDPKTCNTNFQKKCEEGLCATTQP